MLSSALPSFRQFLPSATNPHPRFDLSTAHQETPYTWVEKTNAVPSIINMKALWQERSAEPYKGFTTDGNLVPGLYSLENDGGAQTEAMVAAAEDLIAVSKKKEKKLFSHAVDADEWRVWANPELYINQYGVRLEESTPDFQQAVLDLLQASLSEQGYAKAAGCMKVNAFLGTLVNAQKVMNFHSYNFNLFGTPSLTSPWGFSLFGHHLALNIFVLGSQIVISPTFMGAEPDVIDEGPDSGLRLFEAEENEGLAFMQSLSTAQKQEAQVFSQMEGKYLPAERYNLFDERHVAGAFQDNRVVPYEGLSAKNLSSEQQEVLVGLVGNFVAYLPPAALAKKLDQVRAHLGETWFSWYGGYGAEDTFYYRIHSPVVIVEFDHHKGVWLTNSTPAKAHIHTCVRTPNGNDYGRELLRLWRAQQANSGSGSWSRLVRFIAEEDGATYFGDVLPGQDAVTAPYTGLKARVLKGDPLAKYEISKTEVLTVKKLLSPLPESSVPIVRMVGLNYAKHLVESNKPLPSSPCLFISGSGVVNGPFDEVPVPKVAQEALLDYEGELVIVIGKRGRNIPRKEAESYIAGYATGNDVSARKWQRPDANGGQWCFSKGFDKWAPFGPWLSSRETTDIMAQSISVYVNDEPKPRQSSPLDDMIFKPADVVSFFSQGTTLEVGTVIFTGTPHGVGFAMSPPGFLKDGDVVKVAITPDLGGIENKMVFEKDGPPVLYAHWVS